MEARAITFLGMYGPLFSPDSYFPRVRDIAFSDLDANVGFYADPADGFEKLQRFVELTKGRRSLSSIQQTARGRSVNGIADLIGLLRDVSEFACFLEVTPPEVVDLGWQVVGVVVPELITMCIPGVPFSLHPRFSSQGGIINEFPHPLP